MLDFLDVLCHFHIFSSPIFHLFVFLFYFSKDFLNFNLSMSLKNVCNCIFNSQFLKLLCYFLIASYFNSSCLWMQYHLLSLENFN